MEHTDIEPVIDPAPAGAEFIPTNALELLPLLQPLVGVTVTFPPKNPKVTVMEPVPFPAVMEAPDGTFQL